MHAYILVKRRAELYSIYSNEEMDRSKYILYTCMHAICDTARPDFGIDLYALPVTSWIGYAIMGINAYAYMRSN